ncbi:MAG: hypothetical protein AABW88_03530 [Nanoarchaeota archaeon]
MKNKTITTLSALTLSAGILAGCAGTKLHSGEKECYKCSGGQTVSSTTISDSQNCPTEYQDSKCDEPKSNGPKPKGQAEMEKIWNKLTPLQREEFDGTPETLYGKPFLNVSVGSNTVFDNNLEGVLSFYSTTVPAGKFPWQFIATDANGKEMSGILKYEGGKLYQYTFDTNGKNLGRTELDAGKMIADVKKFTVASTPVTQADEQGKIRLVYKCNLTKPLLNLFGGGKGGKYLYGKSSKAAGNLDLDSYDGAYLVFSNAISIGGKPSLYAKVQPINVYPGGYEKVKLPSGSFLERNLVLSSLEGEDLKELGLKDSRDIEDLVADLAAKGGCKDSSLKAGKFRLSTDYNRSNSVLSVPRYNRRGVEVGRSSNKTSMNVIDSELEGKLLLPRGMFIGVDGKVQYVFEPQMIGGKGLAELGYASNGFGVSVGPAGYMQNSENSNGNVTDTKLGLGAKAIWTPTNNSEVSAMFNQYGSIKGDKLNEARLRLALSKGPVTGRLTGTYTESDAVNHADIDLRGIYNLGSRVGIYAELGYGKLIDGPQGVKENTTRFGSGLEYRVK